MKHTTVEIPTDGLDISTLLNKKDGLFNGSALFPININLNQSANKLIDQRGYFPMMFLE